MPIPSCVKVAKVIKVFFPIYYVKAHSYMRQIVDNPPENCEFITRERRMETHYNLYYQSRTVRKAMNGLLHFSSVFITPTYLQALMEKNETTLNADIVYASSTFYLGKLPWVIDCEDARSFYRGYERLFPFHKNQIQKILARNSCKKILPWTEKAKQSIFANYDTEKIRDKIQVIPLTIKSTPIKLKAKQDITFLFVGSSNIEFIQDFYYKGGLEVIKAFKQLNSKYANVNLILRSVVDQNIRKEIQNSRNIHIIDSALSQEELNHLYLTSSVFVFPCLATPGMVFVEAMNFGLPIISTNYWANSEYITDYYNGFLVDTPKNIKGKNVIKCTLNYSRNIGYHQVDENQIQQIAERMKYFIENPNEILKMGKNAKSLIEKGKYSLETKNKKLQKIFEECVKK
jgi:glycosyltransferase involved in cell wall biosynthesis